MTYYSTVGGWCLTYLFEAIMGNAASSDLAMLEKTFLKTVSTPVSAIFYQTLFLAITAGVLIFGVNKGIERMSKVLMPLLFVLMIVLIIRGLTLPGAWKVLSSSSLRSGTRSRQTLCSTPWASHSSRSPSAWALWSPTVLIFLIKKT